MLPFEPAAALEVVRRAAELSLQLRGQALVEVKADHTLVTEADRQLEHLLHQELGALAPEWSFFGEETGLTGDAEAPCWVIDPIDGTTNFVRHLPLWCISVGAVQNGRSIFGIIAVPPQDELFWAVEGGGAWRERGGVTTRLHAPDRTVLMQEDLIACNTMVERAVDFGGVPCGMRNFGSLAYHLTALARGALCAAIARKHKLYDIAGGVCLCVEAGCTAGYLNGDPWRAEVSGEKEDRAFMVAPPQTAALLRHGLVARLSPDTRDRE